MNFDSAAEFVNLLLDSVAIGANDGLSHSFLFGPIGASPWERRYPAALKYDKERFLKAALFLRQNGPRYLRYESVDYVSSIVKTFLSENYMAIAANISPYHGACIKEIIRPAGIRQLVDLFCASSIVGPKKDLYIFPLSTVVVVDDFASDSFSLRKPENLCEDFREDLNKSLFVADQFPPLREWRGQIYRPQSWVASKSPSLGQAKKTRAAVLAGISLRLDKRQRYLFSGREVARGRCVVGDEATVSFSDKHTPPLMHNAVIDVEDIDWLKKLNEKITSEHNEDAKQIRSLEYLYRAWFLNESERFPWLCMAMDSIYGDAGAATKSVVDAVQKELLNTYSFDRVKMILRLRSSVIHGGAPDVYESNKYYEYYNAYKADPIEGLEIIAASCIRSVLFEGASFEKPRVRSS